MIKLTYQDYMDYVAICRANPKKTTTETLELWREWLVDVYGKRCVEINGRLYPPTATKGDTFTGSILDQGKGATERRYVLEYGKTEFMYAIWSARLGNSSRRTDMQAAAEYLAQMPSVEQELAQKIYNAEVAQPTEPRAEAQEQINSWLSRKGISSEQWREKVSALSRNKAS